MKIRCRECKTIYDDSEKYCPYCFTRTKPNESYAVRMGRIEGKAMSRIRSNRPLNKLQRRRKGLIREKLRGKQSAIFNAIVYLVILMMIVMTFMNSIR